MSCAASAATTRSGADLGTTVRSAAMVMTRCMAALASTTWIVTPANDSPCWALTSQRWSFGRRRAPRRLATAGRSDRSAAIGDAADHLQKAMVSGLQLKVSYRTDGDETETAFNGPPLTRR